MSTAIDNLRVGAEQMFPELFKAERCQRMKIPGLWAFKWKQSLIRRFWPFGLSKSPFSVVKLRKNNWDKYLERNTSVCTQPSPHAQVVIGTTLPKTHLRPQGCAPGEPIRSLPQGSHSGDKGGRTVSEVCFGPSHTSCAGCHGSDQFCPSNISSLRTHLPEIQCSSFSK